MLAMAFLRRDMLIDVSYRLNFAFKLISIFIAVPLIFFVGELVDGTDLEPLKPFGGNYFAFLLVGVAFGDYLWLSLRTFTESLRESQLMGTLEIVLLSPVALWRILVYSSLWAYIFQTVRLLVYLLVGLLFGLELGDGNYGAAIVILLLSIVSFASLGMLVATATIIIKRGDTLGQLIQAASLVFGGIMVPISVFPGWLQLVSKALPITYALEGMRLSLLQGHGLSELTAVIVPLVLFSVVLLPLALLGFWGAVRLTKITGTLMQY